MALPNPSPERFPVLSFVGIGADLLFWEKVDLKIQRVRDAAIGDAHWDSVKYPSHKLVHKAPLDAAGQWHQYFYAADREDQDDYNWQFDGSLLTRTYILPRADYLTGIGTLYGAEARATTVGDSDAVFTLYGFSHEEVQRAPKELESLYVVLTKTYQQIAKTRQFYDDELGLTVTEITRIVPRGSVTASSTAGTVIEINPGNQFYDLKVTQTIGTVTYPGGVETITLPTLPYALTSYIADVPYRFPPLMRGARMIGVYAFADSATAAYSYDEAWYIDWDIVDPQLGPYEARILRFVASDPNTLRTTYPIQKIVTQREDIGIARWWFRASDKGNSTYAEARQIEVPPTIHDRIVIEGSDTLSVGQSTDTLEATPNFHEVTGSSAIFVGYESKQTRYGLFMVEITELNCTGVYDGVTVPFGTTADNMIPMPGMGATTPAPAMSRPLTPNGAFNDDNTEINGTTSPSAEVRAFAGTTRLGSGVADPVAGSYTIILPEAYEGTTDVSLIAYLNGKASATATLDAPDLAPAIPVGSIPAGMNYVAGTAQAGATVNVIANAQAQVETVTIVANRPQVETLVFAGTIGLASTFDIDWTSALVNAGALITITGIAALLTDTPTLLAGKAKTALEANAQILANYSLVVDGANLVITTLVTAADDATLLLQIQDPNGTGITGNASTDTTTGNQAVEILTSGLAKATVTSGITGASSVVRFSVLAADTPTNVADKAQAALALSAVGGHYTVADVANAVSLTALVVAANDTLLGITIENDTCTGLIASDSVVTTSGGILGTTLVTDAGVFSYHFDPGLSAGNLVHLSATDAGGTSGTLVLEASASPPTLTASFSDSDTITGTGTNLAKVRAYVGDLDVGDATISGGTFSLNTDYKLVRGETVMVVAMIDGNEDVRSPAIELTASDLNLEIPVFSYTTQGYVGVVPAGVDDIIIRDTRDVTPPYTETTATIEANDNFLFTLPDAPAGTAFDVYARYPTGDSDMVRVFTPYLAIRQPILWLEMRNITGITPTPSYPGVSIYGDVGYTMQVALPEWVAGISLTVSFPGSALDDIVLASVLENHHVRTLDPYEDIPLTPGSQIFAYPVLINIPLDETANPPVPYPLVKMVFEYPDGQVKTVNFDRSTHVGPRFRDGDWYTWQSTAAAEQNKNFYNDLWL